MNGNFKWAKSAFFNLFRATLLILFSWTGSELFALNERLSAFVWCEVSPFEWTDSRPARDEAEAVKTLLAEARIILSGMLYGYTFLYTPSDKARRVEEMFDLKPVREIPWGDPRLSVAYYKQEDNRLYAKVYYELSAGEQAHLTAWGSNAVPVATGRGYYNLFKGEEAKLASLQEAIKQAIRAYLRPRIYNKPREVSGEVLIWDEPRTVIINGDYVTTLKTKLFIKEIEKYRIF